MKTPTRAQRIRRIRAVLSGTSLRPRVTVQKTARHFRAAAINDTVGQTIVAVSDAHTPGTSRGIAQAQQVGQAFVQAATHAGIQVVVFDRRGYRYHGRVKAFVEALRAGGIKC